MNRELLLRDVRQEDLTIFFEHQRDADAARMAIFPPRDYGDFMSHWAKALADETAVLKTIVLDDAVIGNVVSWEQDGVRNVGYWLAKQYWDRGIATNALTRFLELISDRPLYAHVAESNIASIRVLQKCGFAVCGESAFEGIDGMLAMEFLMKLADERHGIR